MPVWDVIVCVFVGFLDSDYVNQLPCVRYYIVVKNHFKHNREKYESKKTYVFKMPNI